MRYESTLLKMNHSDKSFTFREACVAMVWITAFYSSIIQQKIVAIPYAMLMLGVATLLMFILSHIEHGFDILSVFTDETSILLFFMAYMLIFGSIFSVDLSAHLSQWVTCLEYMFLSIVISSMIKESGTETYQVLLLIQAIALAVVFLISPVYYGGQRYSISLTMNPNGLGMGLAAGIWSTLYHQQKKKVSLILSFLLIGLFVYCIFLTGSRKALIASAITIVLWVAFCFFPSLKEQEQHSAFISAVIIVILIVLAWRAFSVLYSGSMIADRMGKLLYETTEGNRSDMYRAGFNMLKSNPLFGLGFQGFKHEYGFYSHATLVEIPVSSGIIGSIIYFAVYFVSIRKTWRLYRLTKGISELASEHAKIRMIMVLWAVMLFYTTCIIHQYQFDSFIIFGIIFGETAYIENHLPETISVPENKKVGCKYIKA